MLSRLLSFWQSKLFVLTLLGFAATDFLITITLSAADASTHLVENPHPESVLHDRQVLITMVLIALLGAVFLKGFLEAIGVAVALVGLYLALNAVVVVTGLWHVLTEGHVVTDWTAALTTEHGNVFAMIGVALIVFPKLALGPPGFETGVAVMPLVHGKPDDTEDRPAGRIRGTKKLLTTAALIMSVFLITTSFITTVLIPHKEFESGGSANGRALAYLAHHYLGNVFGTVYDVSTILILWLDGRLRDGGPAEPDAALPAQVRHGTALGPRGTAHGDHLCPGGLPGDLALQRGRGRPGRRLRDRCPGAHLLGLDRGDDRRARGGSARLDDRLRRHLRGFPLYDGRQCHRAPGRREDRRLFHRGHHRHLAALRLGRAFELRVTDARPSTATRRSRSGPTTT